MVALRVMVGKNRRAIRSKGLLCGFAQRGKREGIQPRNPGSEIDQSRLIRLAHEIDQPRGRLKQKRLLHRS